MTECPTLTKCPQLSVSIIETGALWIHLLLVSIKQMCAFESNTLKL